MREVIYKKDSKDKIRMLEISAVGKTLYQKSGLIDGKLTEHSSVSTPKNIGKVNETTAEEQALIDAENLLAKKLKEGYFTTIEEARNTKLIKPMLATDIKKVKKIDWFNAYVQRKYDGMRCLAIIKNGKVSLQSRDLKDIMETKGGSMAHIVKALEKIPFDCVLDGELYNLELGSFQSQMKALNSYKPGVSELINFNIYDMVSDDPFLSRLHKAKEIIQTNLVDDCITMVPTYKVNNREDAQKALKTFIGEGFEGLILRHGNDGYDMKRSKQLIKWKEFIDIELVIKDIIPTKKRPEHGQPIFEMNGIEFSAGLKYSHEEREDFLTNKHLYIGKKANLRFFEYTDDKIPRHPVMHGIRDDV